MGKLKMKFEKLGVNNVDSYLLYLKEAFSMESHMMVGEKYDEDGIRKRITDPFYMKTTSILVMTDCGNVIGRLEYHFYGCMQDGHKMAYVNWVYVLPVYRHKGVAQALFKEFEKECVKNDINQYYLIRATNENAIKFYSNFKDVILDDEPILRKELK